MAPPTNQAFFAAQSEFKASKNLQKIVMQRNPAYKRNGLKSYLRLLHKFHITPTRDGPYQMEEGTKLQQRGLAGAAAALGGRARLAVAHELRKKTADGQVGMIPSEDQQWDSMYLTPVQIGTPAQTLMLDFDTGSSDLWVFSTELIATEQKGHTCYDPKTSSTASAMRGYTWQITYGDQSSASGNCYSDTIGLGGLQVENQCVELAQKLSAQFTQSAGDGLLGLAFPNINTVKPKPQATPVENMITQKDIPANAELFTSCMYSERDVGKQSFYTFGFVDTDLVAASGEDIFWTDIDSSEGFWMFPSTSYTINGKAHTAPRNTAIADTGTTLALMSDDIVDALYAQIPGAKYSSSQQGYLIPTSVPIEKYPEFTIAIGSKQFLLQPEDLVFAPADANNWYGAVQSRGDMTFDILGDAFLKSLYCIWDQGNLRFGVVPKISETQTLPAVQS